jgi:hypothetical protein
LVVRVEASASDGERSLSIQGEAHAVAGSATELAVVLEDARGVDLQLEASEGVLLTGLVIVPVQPDVQPPAPEPW